MAANGSKKEIITANLEKIKGWLAEGITMKAIAKNLHVSHQTLYKHLKEEFGGIEGLDKIKKAREPAVEKLENTMFTAATGYTRKVKKYEKLKRVEYKDGRKEREWEEMAEYEVEEYVKPDITAGIFLLKNWAKYMNEPASMEIRRREVELREKQVDAQVW